jgi:hypothetical protein
MFSRSIYNLKIDTIYMYDIPFDRSFLQLSNGIRHVMPSTDPKPELTAKASMAQPVSQPAVYANGLTGCGRNGQCSLRSLVTIGLPLYLEVLINKKFLNNKKEAII